MDNIQIGSGDEINSNIEEINFSFKITKYMVNEELLWFEKNESLY